MDSSRARSAIEELHATAQAFMEAETADEIAEITIDAVREILEMPANGVHLYEEDEHGLAPAAWTDRTEELIGEPPTFRPGEGIAWTAYETGEAQIYDDISTHDERYNPDTEVRSQIVLPLDGHGVLLIGSPEVNAFNETDVDLARTLATHATTALDQLESERALREERVFINQALDAITDVFYVLDPDGTLRRWNDRIPEVTGYTDDEIADMEAVEFFPEDEQERIVEAIKEVLATGQATVEADVLTSDGERIPYEFIGNRLTDREGNLSGLVGVGRDISERKRREQRLARQNERLDQFVSVVSHDLRNPLQVIGGRVELAAEECNSEHLEHITEAVQRSLKLIDDLLTLAREGEAVNDVEPVDLEATIESCWRTVDTADATLVTQTDRKLRADQGRLKQLLENLIRNAVEHGGENVTVTVGDLDGGFYVEDDGPGIPEEKRQQVFEPGHSTADDGTGFGLNIVMEVVTAHGWDISVTEGSAGGARFEITGVEGAAE